MMKLFRFILPAVAALGVAGTAYADGSNAIDGYFRIKNAGADKENSYISITGPFTASPSVSAEDAKYDAGTVLYVKATPTDMRNEFLLQHLRSQGIELFGQPTGGYYTRLQEIMDGVNTDGQNKREEMARVMVLQGMRDGYTGVIRNMVESVIYGVCFFMGQMVEGEQGGQVEGTNIFIPENLRQMQELADRFATEVADQLNLNFGLRYNEDGSFNIFYDVPDMKGVTEWYLKEENNGLMNFGMMALAEIFDMVGCPTGQNFTQADIAVMKRWGYDITAKYDTEEAPLYKLVDDPTSIDFGKIDLSAGDNYDGIIGTEQQVVSSYEKIFSDPELLWNWLKLGLFKLDYKNPYRQPGDPIGNVHFPKMGPIPAEFDLCSMFDMLRQHDLTAMFADYLPYINAGDRYYIINGTVGLDDKEKYGLEFTADLDKYNEEGWGNWELIPFDTENPLYVKLDIEETAQTSPSPLFSLTDAQIATIKESLNDEELATFGTLYGRGADGTKRNLTGVCFDFPSKLLSAREDYIGDDEESINLYATPHFYTLGNPVVMHEDPYWNSDLWDPHGKVYSAGIHNFFMNSENLFESQVSMDLIMDEEKNTLARKEAALVGIEAPKKHNAHDEVIFVPNYDNIFNVTYTPGRPENSFVIDSNIEVGQQFAHRRSIRRGWEATEELEPLFKEIDGGLHGVLLHTGSTSAYDMKYQAGVTWTDGDHKVFALGTTDGIGTKSTTGAMFGLSDGGLKPNSVYFLGLEPKAHNSASAARKVQHRASANVGQDTAEYYRLGTPESTMPTAVSEIEAEGADSVPVYYNLQGIRVSAPVKGQIYIRNGKKVLY